MPIGYLLTRGIGNFGSGGGTVINNYITIPAAAAIGSLTPGLIACVRGDTLRVQLPTPMGDISTRDKLTFTAKTVEDANSNENTDALAVIQVVEGTGLTSLNGAQTGLTAADASLAVVNATTGTVRLTLAASVTAQLKIQDLVWDCQWISSAGAASPISGVFSVSPDVTQATT